jgi:chromosome condensin MukBEF ATPase and DNA-binding subunit MukB
VPTVLLFGNYEELVAEIGSKAAGIVAERLRSELIPLTTQTESLMAKIDDLIVAAQNVSDQATEHRAVVDEAIALIKSGVGADDPRLTAVIEQLGATAEQLDTATSDLAAADDAPVDPEEPVDPEVPVDPETPVEP